MMHVENETGAVPSENTLLSPSPRSFSLNTYDTTLPSPRPTRRCGQKSGSFLFRPVPKLCKSSERGRDGRETSQSELRYDSALTRESKATRFVPQKDTAIVLA